LINEGLIELIYVPTDEWVADILIKPLNGWKFQYLLFKLLGWKIEVNKYYSFTHARIRST
jgi:hypothetical protein